MTTYVVVGDAPTSFVLDNGSEPLVLNDSPASLIVSGEGPIGPQGDRGPPGVQGPPGEGVADPGDLTLIFENKLI